MIYKILYNISVLNECILKWIYIIIFINIKNIIEDKNYMISY